MATLKSPKMKKLLTFRMVVKILYAIVQFLLTPLLYMVCVPIYMLPIQRIFLGAANSFLNLGFGIRIPISLTSDNPYLMSVLFIVIIFVGIFIFVTQTITRISKEIFEKKSEKYLNELAEQCENAQEE